MLPDDRGQLVETDREPVDAAEVFDLDSIEPHVACSQVRRRQSAHRTVRTIGSARFPGAVARLSTVNVIRACLATALLGALVVGPVSAQEAAEGADADPLPERVLFIGNSHTARHGGLDWLIENMVASEDPARPFEGTARAESGVTLEYHYQNGARNAIRRGDFDTVVLQGYLPGSSNGTVEPFLEYARLLDKAVRDSGARTVFFMTWPQGYGDWSTLDDIIAAHRLISAELGAPVAPAALAFEKARAERPDLELIDIDQVHATWEGAYLAAATVYATLFDRSPEGLGYAFGVSADDAAFLQRIAWETLTEWRAGRPRRAGSAD